MDRLIGRLVNFTFVLSVLCLVIGVNGMLGLALYEAGGFPLVAVGFGLCVGIFFTLGDSK